MKYIKCFFIKYALITIVLEIILLILTALTVFQIVLISSAVTILSFLISDLLILSVSNNFMASLTDCALSFFIIYLFKFWILFYSVTLTAVLISSIAVTTGEWFFHHYLELILEPQSHTQTH